MSVRKSNHQIPQHINIFNEINASRSVNHTHQIDGLFEFHRKFQTFFPPRKMLTSN